MLAALLPALGGCARDEAPAAAFTTVAGGDAARGRELLLQHQCGSCHVIADVPAAAGRVGPSLSDFGRRSYIAGQLPNTPQALQQWLQQPQALVPGTTMPDMGVRAADARDMAAFLLQPR